MKTILHIPSWFPSSKDPISGIFVKKMIEAIALDTNYKHIVVLWHESDYLSLRRPMDFLRKWIKLVTKPRITTTFYNNITYINIKVFQSSPRIFGDNENRIYKAIVKEVSRCYKIDLVHAHVSYVAGKWAHDIKKISGVPFIISEHMSPFPFRNFSDNIKSVIKDTISSSYCVVSVSKHQAKEIQSFSRCSTIVIPNVVNEQEFNELKNAIANKNFTFITVGMISNAKGIDILLRAIMQLRVHYNREVKVKICGDGTILNNLIDLSKEIGVYNNIVWLGAISRDLIKKELLSSDAYVCSSRHESFGVAPIEAMACGLPIVSTKCGGPQDYVNETTGILVNNEDEIDLARGLNQMIESKERYNPLKIRDYYLSHFSSSVICKDYISLYERIFN